MTIGEVKNQVTARKKARITDMASSNKPRSVPPSVPRTIDAFHFPYHVRNRFEDAHRPITRPLAADAVEQGTPEPNHIDRDGRTWRYRHRVDGCDVVVAVADADEKYRDMVMLSAFVDLADADAVRRSSTWSRDDMHVAALLQYLKHAGKTVDDAGFDPDEIHMTTPIDYDGHRVVNKRGYRLAVCVDCGRESCHGNEYKVYACD